VANVERKVQLSAPDLRDIWVFFETVAQAVAALVATFGSGQFDVSYSVSHETGSFDADTIDEIRARAELLTDPIRWIGAHYNEDRSDKAPGRPSTAGTEAGMAAFRAWLSDRSRDVSLAAYAGAKVGGFWTHLTVQGNDTNEVAGFAHNAEAVMRARLAVAQSEAVAARRTANPPNAGWIVRAWRYVSNNVLVGGIIAGVALIGIAALIAWLA
jgi:hypothetical protein